jgi:hypothetical protein
MNFSSNNAELSIPLVGTLPQEVDCETVITITLYILLYVQFGLFFYLGDDAVNGLTWTVVNSSICLSMVATHLYRTALTEIHVSSDIAMLIPEILTVTCMGLIYFRQLIPAFLLLVAGNLITATTSVVVDAYRLWYCEGKTEPSSEALCDEASIV